MQATCARDGAVATIALTGAFEAADVDLIERQVGEALNDGVSVLEIDMRDVTVIDSRALGALVATQHRAASQQARLKLSNVSQPVALVLQLTKLSHFFSIEYDTPLDQAG